MDLIRAFQWFSVEAHLGLRQRVRERQEVSKGSDSDPKESLLSSVFFFSGCTMWDLSSPEIESAPSAGTAQSPNH